MQTYNHMEQQSLMIHMVSPAADVRKSNYNTLVYSYYCMFLIHKFKQLCSCQKQIRIMPIMLFFSDILLAVPCSLLYHNIKEITSRTMVKEMENTKRDRKAPPPELRHFLLGYPPLMTSEGKRGDGGEEKVSVKLPGSIRVCYLEDLRVQCTLMDLSGRQSALDQPVRSAWKEALSLLFSL